MNEDEARLVIPIIRVHVILIAQVTRGVIDLAYIVLWARPPNVLLLVQPMLVDIWLSSQLLLRINPFLISAQVLCLKHAKLLVDVDFQYVDLIVAHTLRLRQP